MEFITPILIFGIIALIMGLVLGIASKLFAIEKDERIDKVLENLSGANCGGCGFAGCSACAEAIVSGDADVNACPSCSKESVAKIAEILGVESTDSEPVRAYINCSGTEGVALYKFAFDGTKTCSDIAMLNGGDKSCVYACLGYGDCVKKCAFGALSIKNGIASVDETKCVGCGVCAKTCPKNVISIRPVGAYPQVKCSSKDKGADLKNKCSAGCIGCKLCEKNCPNEAIKIENNLAVIDYSKCTSCGVCVEKCPKKIIVSAQK